MTVRQCTRGAGSGGTGGGVSVVDGNGAGAGATRVRSTGKGEDPSAGRRRRHQGRHGTRESDGEGVRRHVHEFQASKETIQTVKCPLRKKGSFGTS